MTCESALNINFSGRLPVNVLTNIVYFGLNVIIGLVLVPYFLDTLGTVAYGLIPLATSLTSYINLLVSCINISVSRFLILDIHRTDTHNANITFNSALFGTLAIVLILLPIALVLALFSPVIFSTGSLPHNEVVLLFAMIFVSMLITTWSANFITPLTAYNRFDYKNYVHIIQIGTQISLIILLFSISTPSLVSVGIAYLIASVAGLAAAYYFFRKVTTILRIKRGLASYSRFRELGSLAFWEGLNSLSWYLVAGVSLIIVNVLFGAEEGTRYSFVVTWFTLVLSISGLLIPLFVPMIYNYFAKMDINGMVSFSSFATKCMGIFLALPIGLLCIFSPQLMTLWVGEEYANLSLLVWIILIPLVIKVQQSCLTAITTAYLKVHIKALIGVGLGALNIILACTLPFIFDIGVYGVAIAGSISLFILTGIVEPFYDAYLVHKSPMVFLKPMIVAMLCFIGLAIIGSTISNLLIIDTFISVLILSGLISTLYILFVLRFLFSKHERMLIRSCIPKVIGKFIPKILL